MLQTIENEELTFVNLNLLATIGVVLRFDLPATFVHPSLLGPPDRTFGLSRPPKCKIMMYDKYDN